MRYIGEDFRFAKQQHFCDCCTRYIQPGEHYRRTVYAVDNWKRILVTKMHLSCDWPYEEIQEALNSHKEINLESVVSESLAA